MRAIPFANSTIGGPVLADLMAQGTDLGSGNTGNHQAGRGQAPISHMSIGRAATRVGAGIFHRCQLIRRGLEP